MQTQDIPYGYCQCGCGGTTTVAKRKTRRFISGHNTPRPRDPTYVPPLEKVCPRCLVVKPRGEFHNSNTQRDGLQSYCKLCQDERRKQQHARDPSRRRAWKLKTLYGIDDVGWDALFAEQGRACAICRRTTAAKWMTDHCHGSGALRGILCPSCNSGLGQFQDSPEMLLRARAYLVARS